MLPKVIRIEQNFLQSLTSNKIPNVDAHRMTHIGPIQYWMTNTIFKKLMTNTNSVLCHSVAVNIEIVHASYTFLLYEQHSNRKTSFHSHRESLMLPTKGDFHFWSSCIIVTTHYNATLKWVIDLISQL